MTYAYKVYQDDTLVATGDDGLDVVVDGKIIFEGTEELRNQECETDPGQAFCP